MAEIHADQYVFGTLPAGRSSNGHPGNQHIASTQGALSPSEIAELEPRLFLSNAYQPSDVRLKRVYVRLPGDRFVLAEVVPTDASDRGGAYLAHALIVSRPAMEELGFDPFPIFRSHRFHRTPGFLSELGGGADLPPAVVRCEADAPRPAGSLELAGESAAGLLERAFHVCTHDRSLALVGDPVWTLDVLEALFALLSPELRRECPFDSWCEGVPPGGLRYGIVGVPNDRSVPAGGMVYGQTGPAPPPPALPLSPGDAWVVQRVREGQAPRSEERTLGTVFYDWLSRPSGAEPDPRLARALSDQVPSVLEPLARQEVRLVRERVRNRLRSQIGRDLADYVERVVESDLWVEPGQLLRSAVCGYGDDALDALIIRAALKAEPVLAGEASALERYLDRAWRRGRGVVTPELLQLLALRGDWSRASAILATLPPESDLVSRFLEGLLARMVIVVDHEVKRKRGELVVTTTIKAREGSRGDRTEELKRLLIETCAEPQGSHRWPFGAPPRLRWTRLRTLLDLLTARASGRSG